MWNGIIAGLFLVAIVLTAVACDRHQKSAKTASPATNPRGRTTVALLGDRTRLDLLRSVAEAAGAPVSTDAGVLSADIAGDGGPVCLRAATEDDLTVDARLAAEADVAVVTSDASVGSLPIHRERVLLCRQMSVPGVAIGFTRTSAIGDPELLELEELEMRELLNHYQLNGDRTTCLFDDPAAKATDRSMPRGPKAIAQWLARQNVARLPEPLTARTTCTASVYALSKEEAFFAGRDAAPEDVSMVIGSGKFEAIIRGRKLLVEVTAEKEVRPSQSGQVRISCPGVEMARGQRFILLNHAHTCAAGEVTD